MYDQIARDILKEKTGYELWLLEYLSKAEDIFIGGANASSIEIDYKAKKFLQITKFSVTIGQEKVNETLEKLSALTFAASYKIIDMIIEWILEENNVNVKTFEDKNNKIYGQNIYPQLFVSNMYIKKYMLRLYSKLLMFRHEIIHRHNFSVENKILKIHHYENGKSCNLELNRNELGCIVRIVTLISRLLISNDSIYEKDDYLLKYYFDKIQKCHDLPKFGQRQPLVVDVVFKTDKDGETFPIDMIYIKETLGRVFTDRHIIFNLDIIGRINDQPFIRWSFTFDDFPKGDMIMLTTDDCKDKIKELK